MLAAMTPDQRKQTARLHAAWVGATKAFAANTEKRWRAETAIREADAAVAGLAKAVELTRTKLLEHMAAVEPETVEVEEAK